MRRLIRRWAAVLAVVAVAIACGGHVAVAVAGDGSPASGGDLGDHDLKNEIASVEVEGGESDGGAIKVRPGTKLTFELDFQEKQGKQFDNDWLGYYLPQGFDYGTQQGTFRMQISNDSGTYTMDVPYTIENGELKITWPKDDAAYGALIEGSNGKFSISLDAVYENAQGAVDFGNGVTKTFELDNSHDVGVTKEGWVGGDGKIHYTVRVTSTGRNQNVHVSDTVTGSALTFDADSLKVEGNSSTPTRGSAQNGFDLTFLSMQDGETATITYTASIDYNKVTGRGTAEQTGNSVTVTGKDVPGEGDHTATKDFANSIDAPSLNKSGQVSGDTFTENGRTYQRISWTIDANSQKRASLAGRTISDQIADGSKDAMKYSGDRVQIQVYDASGSLVETRNVPWSELGADPTTATSWTYHVPDTDKNYEYKIAYTTDVDMTDSIVKKTVSNSTSISGGLSAEGKVDVPSKFEFDVKKKFVGVADDGSAAQWQFTITVPAEGYTSLEAVDTLPSAWVDNKFYADQLDPGSITVDGLADGEAYDVASSQSSNGPGTVSFTFYKDQNKTQKGLTGTGEERTITVTLTTKFDETWLEQYPDSSHENNVQATANSVETRSDKASVIPSAMKQSITKNGAADNSPASIDGVNYPVYRYELVLTGVNGDIDIDDEFDTSLLKHYQKPYSEDAKVFAGNQYYQGTTTDDSKASITSSPSGAHIHVAANNLPKNADGSYYSHYKIVYYLVVKDANALGTLNQQAAHSEGGKTVIENTATWGSNKASKSIDYTYDYLTKELTQDPAASENHRTASYEIDINSGACDIDPNGDALTLTDEMTNQELDVGSVTLEPSEGTAYDYDPAKHVLTVKVPDGTPVKLKYKATVIGSGNVSYSNTAKLHGQSKGVQQSAQLSNSGAGSVSVPYVKLLKHAAGNEEKPLAGASFTLYRATDDGKFDENNPVKDKNGNPATFVSGDDGIAVVRGGQTTDGWTLEEGQPYYLVETEAPHGYKLDPTPIKFIVTDNPIADDEHVSGFTIDVDNAPLNPSGYTLPDTGGPGVQGVYVAAAALIAVGAAGLIVRHRRRARR